METRLGPTKILCILPKWRSRIDIREKVMGIKVSYFLRRREWATTHCSTITNKKVRFLWKMPENDKKRPKNGVLHNFFRWLMLDSLKIPQNTSNKVGFRGYLGGSQDTYYTWASRYHVEIMCVDPTSHWRRIYASDVIFYRKLILCYLGFFFYSKLSFK